MAVANGMRVVRGPDWQWEDSDGGEGWVGTVVEWQSKGSSTVVKVVWDNGLDRLYGCNFDGQYNLRLFDSAPAGVAHSGMKCGACSKSVTGTLWQCAECTGPTGRLCSSCYHRGKHSVDHNFVRKADKESPGVGVPPRRSARQLVARGLFPGARVVRGEHWRWGDQDGGSGKAGFLVKVKGIKEDEDHGIAEVKWDASEGTRVYRNGYNGSVDLKCERAGPWGQYYPDHLPELGKTVSQTENVESDEGRTTMDQKDKDVAVIKEMARSDDPSLASSVILGAAMWKDSSTLRGYLQRFPDRVNIIGPVHSQRALHVAAHDNIAGVIVLLEFDADVNVTDGNGYTPLHVCASRDNVEVAQLLLRHGADPNVKAKSGNTPLIMAALKGSHRMVRLLANQRKTVVDMMGSDGGTALHSVMASTQAQDPKVVSALLKVVSALLKAGAEPGLLDDNGYSPLHLAARFDFVSAVDLYVEQHPKLINSTSEGGFTALHIAANKGNLNTVLVIITNRNCDINVASDTHHETALLLAMGQGNTHIIELLIGFGADINMSDNRGTTPLHVALLLDHASFTAKPLSSYTRHLLKVARQFDIDEDAPNASLLAITCLLVSEGADLAAKNKNGDTPLDNCSPKTVELVRRVADQERSGAVFCGSQRASHGLPPLATKPPVKKVQESLSVASVESPVCSDSASPGAALPNKDPATPPAPPTKNPTTPPATPTRDPTTPPEQGAVPRDSKAGSEAIEGTPPEEPSAVDKIDPDCSPTLPHLLYLPHQSSSINVIKQIGAVYYKFGILLLKDDEGVTVEALRMEHHHNAELINLAILQAWVRGESGRKPISWATLVAVLREVDREPLARKIMSALAER